MKRPTSWIYVILNEVDGFFRAGHEHLTSRRLARKTRRWSA